ncbi:MAG: hypothetical protein ACE5OQ_04770 [Woeseia sp.]
MSEYLNISEIEFPAFLLNAPLSMSADIPNNCLMEKRSAEQRRVDRPKALRQFHELYSFLCSQAIVYLLPSHPGLQDQPSVSNLGVVLPHLSEDTVVVSRFRTEPRIREAAVGMDFFRLMNFTCYRPPEYLSGRFVPESATEWSDSDRRIYFEGEADLKYIKDNLYVGAYGMRTSRSAHFWFSKSFDMEIIPVRIRDERLFHLDCCLLPVTANIMVACTEVLDQKTLRRMENVVEIIDVPIDAAAFGITNSLLLDRYFLYSSDIDELSKTDPDYPIEVAKINLLEKISCRLNREPVMFNLTEFYKSGAALSCLLMCLNYTHYTHAMSVKSTAA